MKFSKRLIVALLLLNPALYSQSSGTVGLVPAPKRFEIIEATIAGIQDAIKSKGDLHRRTWSTCIWRESRPITGSV